MIQHTALKTNFIYPEIPPQAYKFGADKFDGTLLLDDGDWRLYLPLEEEQKRRGVESSACYVEAQQHAVASIKEQKFLNKDENYSARFNALLSGGTEEGGDPLKGAESIRKHDGLIPESLMDFSAVITSWDDYHSWKGADEDTCRHFGKKYLEDWELNYDIVFERNEPVELKYEKLRLALRRSPVPMSVVGWYEQDGIYIKPKGMRDNHLTLCVYLDDDNCPYFWDTYSPFLKKGESFYNSDFSLRWGVQKRNTEIIDKEHSNVWIGLIQRILAFFKALIKKYANRSL